MTPIYVHYLIYSPPVRDIFIQSVLPPEEYYKQINENTTVFFKSECLTENIIEFERLGIDDFVVTRDDRPWEFINFLESTKVYPKKIIVLEDTSFFIFYKLKHKKNEIKLKRNGKNDKKKFKTYSEYVLNLEDEVLKQQQVFLNDIQKTDNIIFSPALLREYIAEYIDRYVKRILPTRSRHLNNYHYFWTKYLNYFYTGDASNITKAFSIHRSNFVSLSAQNWLTDKFIRLDHFDNANVPGEFKCEDRSLADNSIKDKYDDDSFPAIKQLRKAGRNGVKIKFIILPSNPNYEVLPFPQNSGHTEQPSSMRCKEERPHEKQIR